MLSITNYELVIFDFSSSRYLTRVHFPNALLAAIDKCFWRSLAINYMEIIIFSIAFSLIYCLVSMNCYPEGSINSQIWSFVDIPRFFLIKICRHLSTTGKMVTITLPIRTNSTKCYSTLMTLLLSINVLKKNSGMNLSKI